MFERGCGTLLHITSLPSEFGIGDLGPGAYRFADFLHRAGQKYWQILPLNPTSTFSYNSPYSSYSAFAGNPLLISPRLLVEDGFLEKSDIEPLREKNAGSVDYDTVTEKKNRLLARAYDKNRDKLADNEDFDSFCELNSSWLTPCSLFVALKERFGDVGWADWPKEVRDREENALQQWRKNLSDKTRMQQFHQFLFYRQWRKLRKYCNERGIRLIGDLPIYVNHDSADVWLSPNVFKLNGNRRPEFVAGVPPDYFSKTGQLWGNPVYRWRELRHRNYDWWLWRIEHNLNLFDIFRLDHFRGFVAFWEVKAGSKTAVKGHWVKVPVDNFFHTLLESFPNLPMIAEDLGMITDDVREVMKRYGFPGMKVLQFAFNGDLEDHPYLPHNYTPNCVAYTGTHDNNTVRGWYENDATEEEKKSLEEYLGHEVDPEEVHWELIGLAMKSEANQVIIPMQDYLGLGKEARMNKPATVNKNWSWRLLQEQLTDDLGGRLRALVSDENRL